MLFCCCFFFFFTTACFDFPSDCLWVVVSRVFFFPRFFLRFLVVFVVSVAAAGAVVFVTSHLLFTVS